MDTMAAPDQSTGADRGLSLSLTSGIMVSIMLLLAFFLFAFFIYLRQKQYWGAIPAFGRLGGTRADPTAEPAGGVPRGGLDAAAIESLPSLIFRLQGAAEAIDCSVCITVLADGEAARLLPKCGHGFHAECVDMWLRSHSTCPLCRCAVVSAPSGNSEPISEVRNRPRAAAAVSEVASATERTLVPMPNSGRQEGSTAEEMVVIEIPGRMTEGLPPPASPLTLDGSAAAEEGRSPTAERLRALRRLLIAGK